ncbi:MAG: aminotransferase class I/II-fold pyridoxal phosphate-dependent enzyme [Candidatus Bathyarchaeia archaeon]|jgi:aspartate/methionine/tyrosine aminotransferase|nr:aminotransferase class I/II-fold pyridoxal phosphate-dependent enzyme [Candidatus Bathyarchaeota archaeon A05DMB-4]MDH7594747.1 aminotransferase class I/II-fold pyridoxal phosphate-dependent enzyme [Candidatus Bathyarchaeota archaeon]
MRAFKVSKRAKSIEYAIRDIIGFAKNLEKQGRKILYLNIGDPVKYDFDTPKHIKQALFDAVNSGANWYAASEGERDLKESICEKEKKVNGVDITPENVIVTAGVSEGIHLLMAAMIEKGDEVLIPGPTYPPYMSYVQFFEGTPVAYRTIETENWQPDIDDIRAKISKSTRAIVIINPNNPSGALYDEKTVKQILDIAGEHNLLVLSDEIYDRIVYEKKFVSTSHIAKDLPVVGLNGFSKAYLMTGWRLGYLYFHDTAGRLNELKECIEKETRIRLSACTPVQKAGAVALRGPQDHIKSMVDELRKRRDFSWKRLNEISGISCTKPEGAFYVFPKIEQVGSRWKNDMEFVLDVLNNTGVLFVPGSGFGEKYGSGHVRAVFCAPLGIMQKAFDMLEGFMKK